MALCCCSASAAIQHGNSKPRPVSQMPVLEFQWARDSKSLWVIAANGADEPVGRLNLNGRFEQVSQGAAMRRIGGLAAANDVVAWVQSDGSHYGTIWVRDRAGKSRILMDPNPQTAEWGLEWTQEVVRWKNGHGEELQGILARPTGSRRFPLLVDPYSSWRNRFLNIPVLGNYAFTKAGFAVFLPDHRAPHTFPEMAFGEAYVGASRDRDPVDVLKDDVMTGIAELVRRGIGGPGPIVPLQFEQRRQRDRSTPYPDPRHSVLRFLTEVCPTGSAITRCATRWETRQFPAFWVAGSRKTLPNFTAASRLYTRWTK